jgi:hypothetical protein
MKHARLLSTAVATIALFSVGCASLPILNVTSAPVNAPKQLSMQEVENAITRAGKVMSWQMKSIRPGQLEGTLHLRTHKAVIDIIHTTSNYSINYKDSSNVDYDGTNINRGYNRWVKSLDDAIKIQLASSF